MDANQKVVWQEGMFIAPQHFQQQDRYVENYIHKQIETVAGIAPYYGLTQFSINTDMLKIGKFVLSQCSGIFPDGTQFNLSTDIVGIIPDNTVNSVIYLALPISLRGNDDFTSDLNSQSRYSTKSIDIFDTTTSENASVEVSIAQLNISIKLENEDVSGFTLVPIAKVLECSENGEVMLDKSFIPSCLHYGASQFIVEKLKEIQVLTNSRATSLLNRIEAGQGQKSAQSLMQDYLWFQTLNSWLPWFDITLQNPKVPTHDIYQKLKTYEAALQALQPQLASDAKPLRLDSLYSNFNPLFSNLRNMLTLVQQDSVIEFNWDDALFEKRRLLRTMIKDSNSVATRRFVLSVKSTLSVSDLLDVFPESAKLSSNSKIVEIVRSALSGVKLTPLPVAPSELKPMQGTAYFEVDTTDKSWQEMLNTRDAIALHVDSRVPNFDAVLYALR
ncbi:type VI secretion system baseplate subunit TssK [Vibrio sp.]|nr:type VI secretion system baseplate subunit TssK [Vibrio sp.]